MPHRPASLWNPRSLRLALGGTIVLCTVSAGADGPSFERDIAPILEQRCVRCHHGASAKGGLAFDMRARALAGGDSGLAIVPGMPDESLILDMISGDPPDMPKQGPPL